MKIAIISDIHANIHALEDVLADASRRGASQVLCLGDVVGYGPCPEACVEQLRTLKIPTVLGNHDKWAMRQVDFATPETAPSAVPGIDLARKELTITSLAWLRKLPLLIKQPKCVITHATFHTLDAWDYINDASSAALSFNCLTYPVGFYGHTHCAGIWRKSDMQWFVPQLSRPYKLNPCDCYLINPGSVGNPRTPANKPDNRAQYLIFDDCAMSIMFYRIKYDIKSCITAMKKAGLTEEMMSRIELGY